VIHNISEVNGNPRQPANCEENEDKNDKLPTAKEIPKFSEVCSLSLLFVPKVSFMKKAIWTTGQPKS